MGELRCQHAAPEKNKCHERLAPVLLRALRTMCGQSHGPLRVASKFAVVLNIKSYGKAERSEAAHLRGVGSVPTVAICW